MQTQKRIMIGAPAYDWRNDVRFTHSYGETIRMGVQRGVDVRGYFEVGKPVCDARNQTLKAALEYQFDDLVFIDTDQDWLPEWVFQICEYPVDCVGAPVHRKTDEEIYNVKAFGGASSLVMDTRTGLVTAPDLAIGTGFLRLSRKAMQTLWDNSEPYVVSLGDNKGNPAHWIFDSRPMALEGRPYKELVSEDIWCCDRLRELGVQTWVCPTMNPGHVGFKRWQGDFKGQLARWGDEARSAAKPDMPNIVA